MKSTLLLNLAMGASVLALSATAIAENAPPSDDAIPNAFPRERYSDTISASPFALATPPPPPPDHKESPFANIVVSAIAKTDDGRDYVILQRLGDEGPMHLEGTAENKEGYALKEIKAAKEWKDTEVILRKGGEEGPVKFNANLTVAPAPTAPGKPQQFGQPQKGPQSFQNHSPAPAPLPNIPHPAPTPVPQRPTSGAPVTPGGFRGQGVSGQPGTAQPIPSNSGPPRPGRIRTINNR